MTRERISLRATLMTVMSRALTSSLSLIFNRKDSLEDITLLFISLALMKTYVFLISSSLTSRSRTSYELNLITTNLLIAIVNTR